MTCGDHFNTASGWAATVAGGSENVAAGGAAAVGGGFVIYTNAAMTTGVYLPTGGSTWQPLEVPGSTQSNEPLNNQDLNDRATVQELYAQNQELMARNAALQAAVLFLAAALPVAANSALPE